MRLMQENPPKKHGCSRLRSILSILLVLSSLATGRSDLSTVAPLLPVGADPKLHWTADWIGLDDVKPAETNSAVSKAKIYLPAAYLRTDFTVPSKPVRAILYVTAVGHVEPHLNGARVSADCFTPGWSDYKKRLYYRAYDVTERIREGTNTLGAVLGDGWFRGNISNIGQNFYGKKTRIRLELHLSDAAGHETTVTTSRAWKATTGPIIEADMQAGETYDARLEMPGWDKPCFENSGWKSVVTGAEFEPAILEPHPSEPVRATQELSVHTVSEPRPGVYVVDFGQNFAGWVRLHLTEQPGTRVVLRFAEMLNADGTVYTANLRSARATDTYITKGGGSETWEPGFTYHGFRYVEVTGLNRKPEPGTFTAIVAQTDLPLTGSFACSDPLINQIFKNTLWGQRSNYLEVPTDCPQRDERLGWSGDTQVFSRTGLYNMRAGRFLAKWLRDLADGQSPQGAYPILAPAVHGGWSPAWADAGPIVAHEIWRSTEETAVLREHYGDMKKHLEFYRSQSPGLIGPDQGFGDWLAIGPSTPKRLIATAYFAHSAALLAEMAGSLGEKADAATFGQLFEAIRSAFQKEFVAADGRIGSGSMTCYLLALRFNLLAPDQYLVAQRELVDTIASHPDHLCGFVGIGHLLPTLAQIGRSDLAYKLLQKRSYPSWGYSIDQGATTVWERWNSFTKERGFGDVSMNSFNHYAYGACVEWLYIDVLGIQPLEPGYGKIQLRARPGGGLTWAKGYYDSVRGRIVSEWKIENGQFRQDVTIPNGTSAILWLATEKSSKITADDRPATDVPGVKILKTEKLDAATWSLLELQPGSYHFTTENLPRLAGPGRNGTLERLPKP